jgi:hypothetical protein
MPGATIVAPEVKRRRIVSRDQRSHLLPLKRRDPGELEK